jgi:hypothetical protein
LMSARHAKGVDRIWQMLEEALTPLETGGVTPRELA